MDGSTSLSPQLPIELFAHQIDGKIISVLDIPVFKRGIRHTVDAMIESLLGPRRDAGIAVTVDTFPRVSAILSRCCNLLGIAIPTTFVMRDMSRVLNAFTLGTDEAAYLCLSPKLVADLTDVELTFIIGHECGHIACGHVLYHTMVEQNVDMLSASIGGALGQFALKKAFEVALPAWSRRSEITADRAGLVCALDLAAIERLFILLATGSRSDAGMTTEELLRLMAQPDHWQDRHPSLLRRLKALQVFRSSEVFCRLTQQPPPPNIRLSTQQEVFEQVETILRTECL